MIIVMKAGAAKKDKDEVLKRIKELGYKPHVIHGATRDVIGAVGDERGKAVLQSIESMHGVENVVPILQPYKLASKEVKKESSIIPITDTLSIGGKQLIVDYFNRVELLKGPLPEPEGAEFGPHFGKVATGKEPLVNGRPDIDEYIVVYGIFYNASHL